MPLNITVSDIRNLAGVTTEYDTTIQFLIDLFGTVIEGSIEPRFLGNGATFANVRLGAMEVVAGELFAWIHRQPGFGDRLRIGNTEITPYVGESLTDPSGLKGQGRRRLRPYFRTDPELTAWAEVWSAPGKRETGS